MLCTPDVNDLPLAAALFGPLFLGLVFHGLCIKFGWMRSLAVPIDRGRQLRGRPLFGENKSFRGILAVALGAAGGYGLQSAAPGLQAEGFRGLSMPAMTLVGFGIGAAAMLTACSSVSWAWRRGAPLAAPLQCCSIFSTRLIFFWVPGWWCGLGFPRLGRCFVVDRVRRRSASNDQHDRRGPRNAPER